MKIGEFAKKNNTSIDTIRHYMDLGLLIVRKTGGQYDFGESCQQSLTEIFALKSMGFSLSEIKTIFLFRSLGRFTDYQQQEYFRSLYSSRLGQISRQIDELSSMKTALTEEMKKLNQYEAKGTVTLGVDVSALNIIKCRKCGSALVLSSGKIEENRILSGTLKCTCGNEYKIENGIIFTSPASAISDKFSEDFIADYIKNTDGEYLDKVYKSIEYFSNIFDMSLLEGKVILELGSGMGFLLRNLYSALPDSSVYLAVDYDINRHLFLKAMLEKTGIAKNVLFVCGDFRDTPLPDESADIIFDFSGTSNFSFDNTEFLLSAIDPMAKRTAYLAGSYIVFKNFSPNGQIDEANRKNFVLKNIKKNIADLGYKTINESTSDYLTSGGRYEDYFVEGEKVFSYQFFGKRQG
ncbi:MAG: MerR family transcriptional regulator [Clostridia bacterium]|nr:MerR family transcriptional regulator [Clostridia bacterium]